MSPDHRRRWRPRRERRKKSSCAAARPCRLSAPRLRTRLERVAALAACPSAADAAPRKPRRSPTAPSRRRAAQGKLRQAWSDIQVLVRLVRAWARGEYRDVSRGTIALILGALVYFVAPLDAIFDHLPLARLRRRRRRPGLGGQRSPRRAGRLQRLGSQAPPRLPDPPAAPPAQPLDPAPSPPRPAWTPTTGSVAPAGSRNATRRPTARPCGVPAQAQGARVRPGRGAGRPLRGTWPRCGPLARWSSSSARASSPTPAGACCQKDWWAPWARRSVGAPIPSNGSPTEARGTSTSSPTNRCVRRRPGSSGPIRSRATAPCA